MRSRVVATSTSLCLNDTMKDLEEDDRSIAAQLVRSLSRKIVLGELKPGQPLRQDAIAAEFKTSHVPVREAFQRLQARGLLVSEPRKGVRVAPFTTSGVIEVAEMRAALEPLALRLAAPNLDSGDLAAARKILRTKRSKLVELEAANRAFHMTLYRRCGYPRLLSTINDLQEISARYLFAAWRQLGWESRSAEEHEALLEALEAGHLSAAEEILKSHILEAGQAVASSLEAGSI
jgi:DNA-binding GntR family transcriptional regulator